MSQEWTFATEKEAMQDLYNVVKTHLLAQLKKSIRLNSQGELICAYRGDNGLSCALGCLIPDEAYHPDIEGETPYLINLNDADSDTGTFPRRYTQWIGINGSDANLGMLDLMTTLQGIHDNMDLEPKQWDNSLEHTATRFGLNPYTP